MSLPKYDLSIPSIILRLLPIIPNAALIMIALCAAELGYSIMKSLRFGRCQNLKDSGSHDVNIAPTLVLPKITMMAVIMSRFDSKLRMIKARYAADAMKNANKENMVAESG